MGTISNKILISSVNDGTTIHGSLRVTKSLTQGWNGAVAVPDWESQTIDGQTNPFYHPVVYLTLFNGDEQVPAASITRNWYYNGTLLTFNASGMSTNAGMANWFHAYNGDPDGASGVGVCPCLEICVNLASSANLDIDLIKVGGSIEIGGAPVPFEAGIDVTISKISADGWMGVLYFTDGKSTVDGDNDSVTINASLFKAGTAQQNTWACRWEVNGTASQVTTKTLTLYGRDVTDIATVVCYFYDSTTEITSAHLVYTTMVVVDDVGDPQYLYIRYKMNGQSSPNDGAPVSLHSGQYVTYNMWVADSKNSNSVFSTFNHFYVQPHKANGTAINGSAFGKDSNTHTSANLRTGTYSADGFVEITASTATDDGTTVTGGVFSVDYTDTAYNGGNISMIVIATEGARS